MGNSPLTPLYVALQLPEFPAQALLRLRPQLSGAAVAVVEGDPPLELVAATSTRARRLGVLRGMTRAELESFPALTVLRRSLPEERAALAAVESAIAAFTPRFETQPNTNATWSAVLDMTGTTRIFGPPADAVVAIAAAIKTLGLTSRIAASANLHTALAVASSAWRAPILVPPGGERACLAKLPLAALSPTQQQAEVFALWGLSTVGELAALPEEDLIVRLGQPGKRLRALALGQHTHHMVPVEPAFALDEFLELDSPVELLESLLFVLAPMLAQLIARAAAHCYALASVTVRLALEGGAEHVRTLKPALPVADRDLLLKLLQLDLEANPPPAAIVSIALSAEPGDRSKVQMGLFSPQLPEPSRLDVTLARIAAVVGEDRLGSPELEDTHKPDSFRMKRFTVSALTKFLPRPSRPGQTGGTIALRRCRPPAVLTMRMQGRQPEAFYLNGRRYAVEQAFGPWRRSGTWWSSAAWSSEEWDVHATATEAAMLCILTHDLLRKRWLLEATYD